MQGARISPGSPGTIHAYLFQITYMSDGVHTPRYLLQMIVSTDESSSVPMR